MLVQRPKVCRVSNCSASTDDEEDDVDMARGNVELWEPGEGPEVLMAREVLEGPGGSGRSLGEQIEGQL